MASKGGGGKQITGYRYIMATHSGISRGPVNEFCEIRVGDLVAWTGSLTASALDTIDQPDLFGGDEKEGGIKGSFKLLMGEATQVVDSIITDNIEGDNPVPGWRGVTTLFYYGQISSNNPYPKAWKFRVRRSTAGWDNDDPWYPEKALIIMSQDPMVKLTFVDQPSDNEYIIVNGIYAYFDMITETYNVPIGASTDETASNFAAMINTYSDVVGCTAVVTGNIVELRGETTPVVTTPYGFVENLATGGDIHAMNPAHIVYECATNNVWGRGLPRAMMDDAGFRAAADALYDEGFGLCLRWNRGDDVDRFVQLVIDHIGGVVQINRRTGLLTMGLIRDDYDPATLPERNFTNGLIDITEDQASSSDTMVNEVIVEFNDPLVNKIGSVRVQNLASFQSLGSLVSKTTQYLGVPTATLALRLAQRDLELNSSELRRFTLKFNRSAWQIAPGDVIKIHAPTRGIERLIVRVGEVEEDPLTGEAINVKAVQDVFGLPDASYVEPQESFWKPPDRTARVITQRMIGEMTYYDLSDNLPSTIVAGLTTDTGLLKVYARQPSGASIQYDVQTRTDGEADLVTRNTAGFDPTATLVGSTGYYDTVLTFSGGGTMMLSVGLGGVLLIDDEYMRVDALDLLAGTVTVARGVADTIPATHASGARVWWQTAAPTGDFRDYATGELIHVRLLTRTTSQTLDPIYAYIDDLTIGGRQGRPYPPGNMKVNDEPFGDAHVTDGDIVLTWAHRDRIVQGNTLLEHGAGSTGPEPGTTYTIRVYGADGVTLLRTIVGEAGTTWTYDVAMSMVDGDPGVMWFEVEAVRDGLVSWQHYRFYVSRPATFDDGFDFDFDGSM